MLIKFEIDWTRIELAMAKNALSSYLFSSNLKLQTRFKTLRNTFSQIRDLVSESLDDYLSQMRSTFFNQKPPSGCKLSSKKFG